MNNALNDYYDYNQDSYVLKEKKIKMEEIIKEYFQISKKDFNNYPDVAFSKKVLIENINIVRLIAKGKLGNVNNFEFFILLYFNYTLILFLKKVYVVTDKTLNKNVYAMKSRRKTFKLKELKQERNIGLLGNECRFLVKTIYLFQSKVMF